MASKRNGRASGWFGWLMRRIAGGGSSLEEALRRLAELEEKVRQSEEWRNAPPIVIEQVRIDKVVIDKIEHNNNFGALGIKELGGRLNIGANYMLSEDKLPPEGAAGLEALRQAGAAARRDRDGSVGAGAVGSSGAASGKARKSGSGTGATEGGGAASGKAEKSGSGTGSCETAEAFGGAARGSWGESATVRVGAGPKVGIRGQPSSLPR